MKQRVREALEILAALDLPRAQQNERSALCLLALADLTPRKSWNKASDPLIGITPIMEFAALHYRDEPYAPNTRETIRRQSIHQFCDAGIAIYNPDKPTRAVNSPAAVYQLTPEALALIRSFGSKAWSAAVKDFLVAKGSLAQRYAMNRELAHIPLRIKDGAVVKLSPGKHSELIQKLVESFGATYAPDGRLIYAGDTGDKLGYFDEAALSALGVTVDQHGKMPDVIIHLPDRNWLLLCEAVTSHGPVDSKRHKELKALFAGSSAGLVFVTAFLTRTAMAKYLPVIAWETEVWCAEAPTHLIHFNGSRFLGPYT